MTLAIEWNGTTNISFPNFFPIHSPRCVCCNVNGNFRAFFSRSDFSTLRSTFPFCGTRQIISFPKKTILIWCGKGKYIIRLGPIRQQMTTPTTGTTEKRRKFSFVCNCSKELWELWNRWPVGGKWGVGAVISRGWRVVKPCPTMFKVFFVCPSSFLECQKFILSMLKIYNGHTILKLTCSVCCGWWISCLTPIAGKLRSRGEWIYILLCSRSHANESETWTRPGHTHIRLWNF